MCLGRSEIVGCVRREELGEIVKKWFRTATITIVAKCRIEYEGRAASTATSAWRMIIIKEDGTVLVHEHSGRNPLNWQPKAYITVSEEGNDVVIKALRARPREILKIYIESDADVIVARLGKGKFLLKGTEAGIVEELALNPELIEEGARLVSREVSTPHGRIDVVLKGRDGRLILVEVKRSVADVDAVFQLRRYVEYYKQLGIDAKGVIAAPCLSPRAQKVLVSLGFKHVKVEPRK